MADILIKNMEMPTDEDEALVLVLYENGRVRKALDYNIIALSKETTTAQELPPHGDLIDRNELPITVSVFYSAVELEDVLNAPTIIEASN